MRSRLSLSVLVLLSTQVSWAQVQEFRVNTYTTGSQGVPAAAMDSSGNFVIVWYSYEQEGTFGQRFDASGSPLGSEFQVDTYTTGGGFPSVAMNPSGRFVVVWDSQDGSDRGVFAQRFDVDGTPLGSGFQVNQYTTGRQYRADVALDDQGNFVVVWQSGESFDDFPRIRGRRFDVSGSPLGSEFAASQSTLDGSIRPEVAMNGAGEFVISWNDLDIDNYGDFRFDVRYRPYDSSGAPLCGARLGAGWYAGGGKDVAMLPSGDSLLTWSRCCTVGSYDVWVRRFHGCNPVSSAMLVNTFTLESQVSPTIAADAVGNYIVAWNSRQDGSETGIFAQRFDGDDNPVGIEHQVNAYTTDDQRSPAAAMNGEGSFVLTWVSYGQDGSGWGIYAQRGDLATPPPPMPSSPAALSVDRGPSGGVSNLNGVLEAFETVRVEPSRRNGLDSEIDLTATASDLGGPLPAVYEITDDLANYGAIPAGELSGCGEATGDCYEMLIGGPRPAVHWDAVFVEKPSVGPWASWTLHVGESFLDVPTSHLFYADVETIFHHGVTAGCFPGDYCPGEPVRRDQMAVFLLKARYGSSHVPPPCSGVFLDVHCPGEFADWIEKLWVEGLTGGCDEQNYCPSNPVSRAQMAVFLLKAKHGANYVPPACSGVFPDVPCPSMFADWIEQLFHESITAGCGGGNYCSGDWITRGQMATFLRKTFGLRLYGP